MASKYVWLANCLPHLTCSGEADPAPFFPTDGGSSGGRGGGRDRRIQWGRGRGGGADTGALAAVSKAAAGGGGADLAHGWARRAYDGLGGVSLFFLICLFDLPRRAYNRLGKWFSTASEKLFCSSESISSNSF